MTSQTEEFLGKAALLDEVTEDIRIAKLLNTSVDIAALVKTKSDLEREICAEAV